MLSHIIDMFILMFIYFWNFEFVIYDQRVPPIVSEEKFIFSAEPHVIGGRPILGVEQSFWPALFSALVVVAPLVLVDIIGSEGRASELLGFLGTTFIMRPAPIKLSYLAFVRYRPKTIKGKIRLYSAKMLHYAAQDKLVSMQNFFMIFVVLWLCRLIFKWPGPMNSYIFNVSAILPTKYPPQTNLLSDSALLYFIFGLFIKGWISLAETETFKEGFPLLLIRVPLWIFMPSILIAYTSYMGDFGPTSNFLAMLFAIVLQHR